MGKLVKKKKKLNESPLLLFRTKGEGTESYQLSDLNVPQLNVAVLNRKPLNSAFLSSKP